MRSFSKILNRALIFSLLSIQIAAYAQPANDSICNATPISISLGCIEGTNVGATISETAFTPSCWGGSAISNDVWYKFVATTPGMTVSTDVQGLSLTNTQVAVYSSSDNTCTGTLTQIGCDDNSGTNEGNNSIINMASLTPGTSYFIRVDGSGTATGIFCLNVSDTYVPGSTPCEAQIVHPNNLSCEVPSTGNRFDNGNRINNALSPAGYYRPLGVNYCGGDDETNQYGTWSTFIANSTSITITNEVTGTGASRDYTLFSVPDVTDCSNLTCIGSDSAAASATITFSSLTIGKKYFILTTKTGGATETGFRTDYCAKSSEGCTPPANDECANAQAITANQLYLVSTYCANGDTPPDLCLGSADNTIWFTWTVPSSWTGDAFFQLYQQNCTQGDRSIGSQISVYAPGLTCGDAASCVGGTMGGSSFGGGGTQSDNNINAVWTPTPGTTHLIAYDGYAGEVCDMRFQITNKASTQDITVNSTEICPGGTATLTASGGEAYLWDTGETTASITVSPSVTTSYNVTSTAGKLGSAVGFVVVKPLPALNSSLAPEACSGKKFNYTPTSATSGTTYTWKRAAVAGISNTARTGTGDPNETLTNTTMSPVAVKYVYVSTANGCSNGPTGDTVVVTVEPAAVIQNYTTTICSGYAFAVVPTHGVPTAATKIPAGTTYTWSAPSVSPVGIITGDSATTIGNDTISQTLTNSTHSSIATVTYTVTPTLNACSGVPFKVTVTVNPSDSSAFTYALSTYCQNDITADTTAHLTGLPGGTFKSTPGLIIDPVTGKFDLSASTIGDYVVTYVTNGTCVDSSSFNITITLAPNASFTYASQVYCQNTANPSPIYPSGSSAGVFTTSAPGLLFVSNQTGEIDLATSASGTYTVTNTIAAAGTCLASIYTYSVTINTAPVMTNISSTTICGGSAVGVGLTPDVPSSLIWLTADNANITGESITNKTTNTINDVILNPSLLQQSITYTVTPTSNPQGCLGTTQTIDVTINPKPVMTNSSSAFTICSGATISRDLTTDVASTLTWIAGSNTNITGESLTTKTTFTLTNTLTNTSAAVQTVIYSVTPTASLGSCVGSTQIITARVNPKPTFTSEASWTICSGDSHPVTLNTDVASTYTWIATDNTSITGESTTLQTTRTLSNILTNSSSAVKIVTYTATATSTGGGCTGSPQIIKVRVNPTPVMSNVSSKTICSGVPFSIPLKSAVVSTYTWEATDNSNTTGETTATQTTNTVTNTLNNNTLSPQIVVYTATPTSTNTPACPGPDQTINITVNPNPTMTSVSSDLVCGGGNPSSIALSADLPSTYAWKTTNNPNTTGESTTTKTNDTINDAIVNLTEDLQTLTYTVTPTSIAGSCKGAAQTVVQTIVKPRAYFSNSPENGTPPLLVNFTNSSENSNTYQWIYGDGAIDTTTDASHTYNAPNIYTVMLIATNNNLCPDTATSTLIVYKLVVSNVFTPNGDGNNDFFAINTIGLSSLGIEIFNRWGIKLYESNTLDGKWDGHNSNGKSSEDGTYYYIVHASGIDGQVYTEKGFVTLIR